MTGSNISKDGRVDLSAHLRLQKRELSFAVSRGDEEEREGHIQGEEEEVLFGSTIHVFDSKFGFLVLGHINLIPCQSVTRMKFDLMQHTLYF